MVKSEIKFILLLWLNYQNVFVLIEIPIAFLNVSLYDCFMEEFDDLYTSRSCFEFTTIFKFDICVKEKKLGESGEMEKV